ncbi:MAG: RNA 2',3'-cyclic phosphodiesterase [Euryarchaeota archaeon]|nr:RNA 2',3'-cyclic phosphodiesterase [Euryarchaeota archaeon]
MIRTFIAVDLLDSFIDTIVEIQQQLKGNIKLVDPKQVHITMKFLGDVPEKKVPKIEDALSNINFEPFTARVCGIGAFPKPAYARVIYIGADPAETFTRLYAEVESALAPLGFKREKRPFTPHATLARVKHNPEGARMKLADVIEYLSDVKVGTMDVDTIKLKKSTLTPKGAIYETIKEVHL